MPERPPSKRVMIVDDDRDIRETISQILEDEGYQVLAAGNGREALASLRSEGLPRVILLDLMMPVMSGKEFLEEQRRDPALAAIPVVIITADGNLPAKVATLDVAGSLQKPVSLDQLIRTVERYCA